MAHLIDKDTLVQYLTGMVESACCDKNVERIIRKLIIPHIDTLEVKEVDLEEIIKSHFCIKNINNVKITTTGKDLLNLAMRINKFAMNTAFEQYRQIGEYTGNESLDEEIENTIKMNDMWCGLMPNTLIKYVARHFFELGMQAGKLITAADRGMAEEIIINLKRVEQDYRINLTKEMEWLRNKVKKGE